MKLVVGLGNPGRRYQSNRHNVGFWVLDQLTLGQPSGWTSQFEGLVADVRIGGDKVILLKPGTYMNRSGQAVRAAIDFFKLELDSLLIVCDDFNLKLGKLRLRMGGSAGGQNGLKDVIAHLGTDAFCRLRVGIGAPTHEDPAEFVLSDFSAAEKKLIDESVIEASRAVECWCREGIAVAMNEFNGKDLTKE